MTDFTVPDGYRTLTFTGEFLGRGSSKRPGAYRWTDLLLYKTVGGQYVLSKVGRSMVTHMPGCRAADAGLPRFQEVHPGKDPDDPEFDYHECVPDVYDLTELRIERDREFAAVIEDPESVLAAITRHRGNSVWLPRTSVMLLEEATQADPALRAALSATQRVE